MAAVDALFIQFAVTNLERLSSRIVDCLGRLTGDQIWSRGGETQNAVGNLVLHLCGNVRQWIVAGVGGQPGVRERDAEFAAEGGLSGAELAARLQETVGEAIAAIRVTPAERLTEKRRIQVYDVTVLEAIGHVIEHFSHHTGQIIYATKLLTGADLGYYKHLGKTAAPRGKAL